MGIKINHLEVLFGPEFDPSWIVRPDKQAELRKLYDVPHLNRDLPESVEISEISLGGLNEREIWGEWYRPKGIQDPPVLLYIHGGGWSAGSIKGYRRLCAIAASHGMAVVIPDYALAPEYPFPAGIEDSLFALRWLAVNGKQLGIDTNRMAIGGDSAGANIAAAVIAALLGDNGGLQLDDGGLSKIRVKLKAALFFYGVYSFHQLVCAPPPVPGAEELANAVCLMYFGTNFIKYLKNPLASPIYSSQLSFFPPTRLVAASGDFECEETLSFANALVQSDVELTLSVIPGLCHAFAQMDLVFPEIREELDASFRWLLHYL